MRLLVYVYGVLVDLLVHVVYTTENCHPSGVQDCAKSKGDAKSLGNSDDKPADRRELE